MHYTLSDIIDIPAVQALVESLWKASGIPVGIIDRDGTVLVATGWQEICTHYHRRHPQTNLLCQESDSFLREHLRAQRALPENGHVEYLCKNGMVDIAVPIVIEGQLLATLFLGQFFYEPPAETFFRQQAKRYGFKEESYLEALKKVPIFSRQKVEDILDYLTRFVNILTKMGMQRFRQIEVQEALQESERKLSTLMANLPGMAYRCRNDRDWTMEFVSNGCRTLTGYSPEELIGSREIAYGEIIHLEDRKGIWEQIQSNLDGNVPFQIEYRIITASGEERWVWELGRGVLAANGELLALEGFITDITDRKQKEQDLLFREAFEALIAQISMRFVELTTAETNQGIDLTLKELGEFTGVDRSYVFQLSADGDLMNNTNEWCAEGISPQKENLQGVDVDDLPWVMDKVLNGKVFFVPSVADLPSEAGTEKEHWQAQDIQSLMTVPILIAGDVIGLLGFDEIGSEKQWGKNDITLLQTVANILGNAIENQRAEGKLRTEQFRLSEIIRGTNVGTWEWNVQTGETNFNERWAEIIGYTLEELSPLSVETWLKHVHPDDLRESSALLEKHFTGELDYYELECRMQHKDGRWVWVVTRGKVSSWTDAGKPLLMFGTHSDIDERKRLAEERRTIEKLNTVGTLAGGIAHDFNNILAGLYGNISLAKAKMTTDHPAFRFLDAADKSMNRATLLTNQLLTFAKGGAPVKESLSLVGLVEEVVHFNLSGSNVKPVITAVDNLWLAKADQGQIQQVFGNLTINAKQAMPDGGHLYISMGNADIAKNTEPGLDEGRYLLITVADEGTGIPAEHLGRIFDPYFTTKQTGSGLGLATIYSIINRHGGHISVASQRDKGTTFTLFLPASESQERPQKQTEIEPPVQGQTAKILVMDDEEVIRSTLTAMLEELSFTVAIAADGQQAMDLYQQAFDAGEPFDLVILDLTIPGGIGGEETAKNILKIDSGARMIVSSGYADDPVMANYTEYGFKGVVTKPYNLNKLSAVMSQALEK